MAKAKKSKKKERLARAKMVRTAGRRAARPRQYGVIPVRVADRNRIEVMLMTSRGSGRWVIPKGWPIPKRTPAGTARREAYEEAGIKGRLLSRKPIGSYRYIKADEEEIGEILVQVFVLNVEEQKRDWPECDERRTRWFPALRAAALVKEGDLSRLMKSLSGIVSGNKGRRTKKLPCRKR